jgi:hypothetical protein
MSRLGLETVPILATDYTLDDNIERVLEMSKGKSVINPNSEREGIVIRPLKETMDLEMSRGMSSARLSYKAINENYLLEHEEA